MNQRHWSDLLVAVLAGVGGGFLFLVAADFPWQVATWCSTEETNCVRSWVGALSGYVAALFAGATVFVISRQIRRADVHHKDRMRDSAEQIRQQILVQTLPQRALFSRFQMMVAWPLKHDLIEMQKVETLWDRGELHIISLRNHTRSIEDATHLLHHAMWDELAPYDFGEIAAYLFTAQRDVLAAAELWSQARDRASALGIVAKGFHAGVNLEEAMANILFSREYYPQTLVHELGRACRRLDELLIKIDEIISKLESGSIMDRPKATE